MAEIRRVERKLLDLNLGSNILIAPLHGDLPQDAQDRAIAPTQPGMRKIVLATSIAETSVTIDGIRVVIDAGLLRVPRFDSRSGLTRLETIRVTQDSADQRRGRAGRLESGVCARLWTSAEHQSLALVVRRKCSMPTLLRCCSNWPLGYGQSCRIISLTPPTARARGPGGRVAHRS